MNLTTLTDFNLVAKHGGFGRASRISGRPKASLSRRVMELEESLGLRLFERGTRSLTLTEAGATLFARTENLLAEIVEVGESLGAGIERPRGLLRISVPLLFGQLAMGRVAAMFIAQYPDVQIEVSTEDRMVDLVDEHYDLVIRANPRADESLVGRCFIRDYVVVAAAPTLRRPTPNKSSAKAKTIPAVVLANSSESEWRFTDNQKEFVVIPEKKLMLSSMMMLREAALHGAGAAILPHSLIEKDIANGRLVCWGKVMTREVGVWVLHTSRRLTNPKVSAFVNFLCEQFPDGSWNRFLASSEMPGQLPAV